MKNVAVRRALGRVLVPLAAALALGAAAAGPSEHPERYRVPGGQVAIHNLAGELTVESGSGADVVVEVVRRGKDAASLKVETGMKGTWSTLRVIYPGNRVVYPKLGRGSTTRAAVSDDGTIGDHSLGFLAGRRVTVAGSGGGLQAHADLRVLVPAGRSLQVHMIAGQAHASGIDGDLTIDLESGGAEVKGTRGALVVDTGSGAVRVTDVHGDVTIGTGSGNISVSQVRGVHLSIVTGSGGVEGSDLQVEHLIVETSSGSVDLGTVRADDIRVDTGSGAVAADLAGDVRSLDVDTGSGSITIMVSSQLGAEFDIETGGGSIEVDVAHQSSLVEHDHVRGRIGDGVGRIRLDTGTGGVRLLRRAGSGTRSSFGLGMFMAPAIE